VIGAEEEFRALKDGSHQDASWVFLRELRRLGHGAAEHWLDRHLGVVGVRLTVDLSDFAGPVLEPHIATSRTGGL
jgi:NTE family protein